MSMSRLAAVSILLATGACATTKVEKEWADPALKPAPFQKVIVVVIGPSFGRRQTAEDRIVHELTRRGAGARRSWDLLDNDAAADRERIRTAVEAAGADAVLAVRLLSSEKETTVSQGSEQWVPIGQSIDYFGYVSTNVALARRPEISTVRTIGLETSLWDVASRRMVWSCQTKSETAKQTITTAEIADDYASLVADRIERYLRRG
jgi:hypothetical protein